MDEHTVGGHLISFMVGAVITGLIMAMVNSDTKRQEAALEATKTPQEMYTYVNGPITKLVSIAGQADDYGTTMFMVETCEGVWLKAATSQLARTTEQCK